MTDYEVRSGSHQKKVTLPDNSTVEQVLKAASEAGLALPNPPKSIRGYTTGDILEMSSSAPSDEVIEVS